LRLRHSPAIGKQDPDVFVRRSPQSVDKVKRLLLLGHAKSAAIEPGRFQGVKDVAHDAHGCSQAKALAATLKYKPECGFCSPETRRIADPPEIEANSDLRETSFGHRKGMTPGVIRESDSCVVKWADFSPKPHWTCLMKPAF
jgi:broad specificity phosphatase PhoE